MPIGHCRLGPHQRNFFAPPKKQKLAQGSMSDEYTKSFCVKLSWKCGTCITPNTPRIREHCIWAERRIFRTEDYGGPWQNTVFCIWQGKGIHGVMSPVLACSRVAQSSQSTFQQGRSMDSHSITPICEAINCWWLPRATVQGYLKNWSLVGRPCCRRWSHMCECVVTNWPWCVM